MRPSNPAGLFGGGGGGGGGKFLTDRQLIPLVDLWCRLQTSASVTSSEQRPAGASLLQFVEL